MRTTFLGLLLAGLWVNDACLADISGARLTYKGLDLQLAMPSESPPVELFEAIFGNGGLVTQLSGTIVRQSNQALQKRQDLTVAIDLEQGRFSAQFLSGSIAGLDARYSEGFFKAANARELAREICVILEFSSCDAPPPPMRGVRPSGTKPLPTDLMITIGALPSADPRDTLALPGAPAVRQPGTRSRSGSGRPLGDAVIERAQRAFRQSQSSAPPMLGAPSSLPKRQFFAVHCTAFGAPDDSMRRWVASRKNNIRYQSHGVILPGGEYLPIWPFEDARVWATKTETCPETRSAALGAIINIEVHYFCASNRSDKAADAQYDTLASIFSEVSKKYGPLTIVSHREIDRGLRDGHNDPIGFDFSKFYQLLKSKGIDVDSVPKISDARHNLRTGPDISHSWPPSLSGPLVLETTREDKCRRDHRSM